MPNARWKETLMNISGNISGEGKKPQNGKADVVRIGRPSLDALADEIIQRKILLAQTQADAIKEIEKARQAAMRDCKAAAEDLARVKKQFVEALMTQELDLENALECFAAKPERSLCDKSKDDQLTPPQ